jgi:hypothetical protein
VTPPVPTPIDPLAPDHEPDPDAAQVSVPGGVRPEIDEVVAGWVPDTVPALPSDAGARDEVPGSRSTLTAMSTPPRWGGVRRSGRVRGGRSPSAARLGSYRCP